MTSDVLAVTALVVASVLATAFVLVRGRLRGAESLVRTLERRVSGLERDLEDVRAEARRATTTAHRAARVVGSDEPLPRLVLEPVTAPVVRAVALGAGARRAVARLGSARGARRAR